MKPRSLLSAVDLLPTITELQESESQAQTLDDYMDSIRELSQPTYPLSGPLQGSRLSPLRMTKSLTISPATASTVLAYRPWTITGPEHVSLTLTDSKASVCSHQDPLDWLFAQAQHGGTPLTETSPDVCMI